MALIIETQTSRVRRMNTLHLGAHMSIAGGITKAFERIISIKGTAMQVFTRNQRQWKIPPLTDADIKGFADGWAEWGDYPIAAHDSYLINLANPDEEKAQRAIETFAEELRRCERLNIPGLVTHPGSHLGQGMDAGIERYAVNLDAAIELSGTERVMPLLETTAGQGTNLGGSFQELAFMIAASKHPDRVGVCLDTCHVFAGGYDIRTAKGLDVALAEFDELIGLDRLRFLHLNDSKNPLGSNKDRHEHIGQGEIGAAGFAAIMNHPVLSKLPLCLETPKEADMADDVENMKRLTSYITS